MKLLQGEHVRFFHDQGFLFLDTHIDSAELGMLRKVCDELLNEPPDDDKGGRAHDIGRGHDRRFLRHRHADFEPLLAFVLGDEMKQTATRLLGESPYLFNEQYVVKGPDTGASFAWHQDSAYVGFTHRPYISFWIALDDTNVDNGTVFVRPVKLDDAKLVPHNWDASGKELVGYDGPEEGIAATVPAGSMVAFSSLTLHRSSANTTSRPRRAYLAQYSPGPIVDPQSGQPKIFAVPL